jgi:hypothetical protein
LRQESGFCPHVTIASFKKESLPEIQKILEKHAKTDFGSFEVTSFTLFKSTLAPDGAIHEPIVTIPLLNPKDFQEYLTAHKLNKSNRYSKGGRGGKPGGGHSHPQRGRFTPNSSSRSGPSGGFQR